ncbi:hypothetical protein RB195_007432 [Necator americanus]|uniref:Secreted protein n=1 Tax=Necator americanus TaxID=51031 RepID=A0ABR1BX71_NECAM
MRRLLLPVFARLWTSPSGPVYLYIAPHRALQMLPLNPPAAASEPSIFCYHRMQKTPEPHHGAVPYVSRPYIPY